MSDPANPGATAAAPVAAPAEARKIAPISPGKAAKAGGAEDNRARNPDGTFASTGEREDDGGLPDILTDTSSAVDENDRARTTLDGGEPQKIEPIKHKTTKTRARDVLSAPKPEGAPAVETEPPSDGVAPLPEGAQPPQEGGPEGGADAPVAVCGRLIIAGHEYRDFPHLEQAVKSMVGMVSSETKRSNQRADVAKQNYNAAIAWQGRASAAEAELARLKGTSPPTDAGGGPSNGATPSNPPGG